MFDHFPKYDDPATYCRLAPDELQWDTLLGIPQVGCESIVAASYSNEEITTTAEVDEVAIFGASAHYGDYGDITAGIIL